MSSNKVLEQVYVGKEPIIVGAITSTSQLVNALNWYNYLYTVEEGRPWLLQAMAQLGYEKPEIDAAKNAAQAKVIPTACWLSKMYLNGTMFTEQQILSLRKLIETIVSSRLRVDDEGKKPSRVVDVQASIRKAADDIIGEIEESIDKQDVRVYDLLSDAKASAAVVTKVKKHFTEVYEEVCSPDAKEGWHGVSKWKKLYKTIVDDCTRYTGNKAASKPRKARKKKVKSAVDLLKSLKFQKECKELKLMSIDPANIIGAMSLWVYNTKYKKLTVLHASGPKGLSVKGTTVIGFDEKSSICKTVRKPEQVTKEVLGAGKVALRKIMAGLKTTEYAATGRIGSDTILLRTTT